MSNNFTFLACDRSSSQHRTIVRLLQFTFFISVFSLGFHLFSQMRNNNESSGLVLNAENPLEYNDQDKTVTASGHAILRGDGILLLADRISWNRQSSIVIAQEDVILGVSGYRLLAESLILDLKSGTFTAEQVKTGIHPWVVSATDLVATDSNYTFSNAILAHENHEMLSPSLSVSEVSYDENSSILKAKGVRLRIGEKTIGRLPNLSHTVSSFESRYELLGGEQRPLGWYLGARTDLHRTPKSQSEITVISYFDRGVFLSPQFSYLEPGIEEDSFLHWDFRLSGIKDDGISSPDSRGLPIDPERGYLQILGISRFKEKWRLAAEMNAFSDSEVYRDYDREGFEQSQWNNNALEIAYDGNDLSVSIATRWQGNKYESQAETLPDVLLTYGPKPLWNKWTSDSFQVEYADRNVRDSFGIKGDSYSKFDFGYKNEGVFSLIHGMTYIPSVSFRWQTYDVQDGNNPTRSFWETGNEIRYSMHADYQWENTIWRVDGLRHSMTFSLRHNHTHALKQSSVGATPLIEPYIESPNLGPIELLDYLDSDNLSPFEVLRAGWEHELSANKDNMFTRWLSMQFYQDLWIDTKSSLMPAPYFYAQSQFHPARWLSLDLQAKINTDSGNLSRSSYGVQLLDGIVNQVSLRYLAYEIGNDNVQAEMSHRLSNTKILSGAIRYSPALKTIPYWTGSLIMNSPVGWQWTLYLAQRRGTLRENELNWGLGVNLFSF